MSICTKFVPDIIEDQAITVLLIEQRHLHMFSITIMPCRLKNRHI